MRLRVALSYAWKCSPVALRGLSIAETLAMVELLEDVARKGGDMWEARPF